MIVKKFPIAPWRLAAGDSRAVGDVRPGGGRVGGVDDAGAAESYDRREPHRPGRRSAAADAGPGPASGRPRLEQPRPRPSAPTASWKPCTATRPSAGRSTASRPVCNGQLLELTLSTSAGNLTARTPPSAAWADASSPIWANRREARHKVRPPARAASSSASIRPAASTRWRPSTTARMPQAERPLPDQRRALQRRRAGLHGVGRHG